MTAAGPCYDESEDNMSADSSDQQRVHCVFLLHNKFEVLMMSEFLEFASPCWREVGDNKTGEISSLCGTADWFKDMQQTVAGKETPTSPSILCKVS